MLPVSWDTIRLFLHVLAATVWVGGQLTVAGLLPVLRRMGSEVPRTVARRFAVIAWPAFAVLIGTGIWNIVALPGPESGSYRRTLTVKLAVVAVSGLSAALHARARRPALVGAFGALSGFSALGALFLGIMLAG
jgi:putative copper export protein